MSNLSSTFSPTTVGYTLSASLAIIFNLFLVILKESNPTVLAYMKSLLGHHWTTQGVAVVLVFFVFGFLFSHTDDTHALRGNTLAIILTFSILIGGLGLLGFFIVE